MIVFWLGFVIVCGLIVFLIIVRSITIACKYADEMYGDEKMGEMDGADMQEYNYNPRDK